MPQCNGVWDQCSQKWIVDVFTDKLPAQIPHGFKLKFFGVDCRVECDF